MVGSVVLWNTTTRLVISFQCLGFHQSLIACKFVESMGQVEAAAAKDELKRLRKEMLRLKNEWTTLKALYESAKVHPPVLCSCSWPSFV